MLQVKKQESILIDKYKNLNKKPISLIRIAFIISFIIIPTIHFLVTYVYVNVDSFIMSFRFTENGETFWTFNNFNTFYSELFKEGSEMQEAFRNTFLTFLIKEIMFVVSFFVSYFLYKKVPGYNIFRVCFFLPGIIAGTVVVNVYCRVMAQNGPVAPIVQALMGLDYTPSLLSESEFVNKFILIEVIWLSFPSNMILFGGAFSRIPVSVLESAELDGVTWYQEAFRIIIPMVWPTVSMLMMMSIASVFGATGDVFLITRGKKGTQTISCWMYLQIFNNPGVEYSNAYNYMSAIGLNLTIISVGLALGLRKLSNKFFKDVQY